MKILVTGASGFVGKNLASRLSARHEVFAIIRDSAVIASTGRLSTIKMDLAQPLNAKGLPARIDVIIHLAQGNVSFPEGANELFAINSISTQQLLNYGRRAGARQFMLASTGDVYGKRSEPCREIDTVTPSGYYAVTKHVAELLVEAYSGYLDGCALRIFRPYGPGQTGRLVPNLADSIRQRRVIRLHKGDRPRMTPIYIDDVIHAIEKAMNRSYSGTINIAGDQIVSMRELAEAVALALGSDAIFEETGEEAAADLIGDNNLMKEALGNWDTVSLADGLSLTFRSEEAIA
jgi:nucleoside-diphosphate-sugar epimerase